MLTVRDAQFLAFEQSQLAHFVGVLAAALPSEFPRRHAVLGDAGVVEWIRHGVGQAQSYHITGAEATARYVRLMFVFGRDFDCHPDLAWIRPSLSDSAIEQDDKVNELTRRLHEYVARLAATREPD